MDKGSPHSLSLTSGLLLVKLKITMLVTILLAEKSKTITEVWLPPLFAEQSESWPPPLQDKNIG